MYLTWSKKTISDFSDANVNSLYNEGYLFTRIGKGVMNQTRSVRMDLNKFKLTSENRRILKKTEDIRLRTYDLPTDDYHWGIGKMAKDFYETKFGPKIFSANKIKELLTTEHNFNKLLVYVLTSPYEGGVSSDVTSEDEGVKQTTPYPLLRKEGSVGYAICLETNELFHYSYPFYVLSPKSEVRSPMVNLGLGMMLKAIIYAQEHQKRYVYLGSAQRPTDTYKLQFEGLEWFDGKIWNNNLEELKNILKV